MKFEQIFSIDVSNMYRLLKEFPTQVEEAIAIGKSSRLRVRSAGIRQIVLTAMGGSAIAGDILRNYLAGDLRIPFVVNRQYTLPDFVGSETLVIVSSYSGNTEETNNAHREAIRRRAKILCISSGGKTTKTALLRRQSLIAIPGGLPPRAALGYSFFPLLIALNKMGFIRDKKRDISETLKLITRESQKYGTPDPSTNRALQLAGQLRNRIGIVYAGERCEAVATRWRGQVAENGKALMFSHVLPEMNHNEIVGWKWPEEHLEDLQVFFLRDRGDHKRVQHRMDLTKHIISGRTSNLSEVWSEGSSLLARIFSLVYLGDWMSYYLAIMNSEDPTPVKVIDYLKERLGKIKTS